MSDNLIKQYAYGKTVFVQGFEIEPPPEDEYEDGHFQFVPGKLKPAFPALTRDVQEIGGPLEQLLTAAREMNTDVVVILDGLDRLLDPTIFWSVAQQDLSLLRQLRVSVLSTAPISVLFGGAGIGWRARTLFLGVCDFPKGLVGAEGFVSDRLSNWTHPEGMPTAKPCWERIPSGDRRR